MKPLHRFTVRPALPPALAPLDDLSRNLRWTWDAPTQELFARIDPEAWERVGHNPLRLLDEVGAERLQALAGEQRFRDRLADARAGLDRYLTEPRWYQGLTGAPASIAYFSPEFGVSEVLPQYSGGLGILAGDHLKGASDLGIPLVGVGLFYRHGYFRQSLSADGWQQEQYPVLNPHELPLTLMTRPDSSPMLVEVPFPGATLYARIWRADIGRVPLLLLDADVEENAPGERIVTDRLYGGNSEHRLRQEILLGIGGVRALQACGIEPEVFHTNEGHAGFLGLERIRRLMDDQGLDVRTAIETVRVGTVFTTHTPVPAGIDRFPRELIERYFGPPVRSVALPVDTIMSLGAEPAGDGGLFNMAMMGLRLAQRKNGVSRLHGEVSRKMFASLWPGFDHDDVPITHVTNGVHTGTWVAEEWQEVFARHLGADYRIVPGGWEGLSHASDEELWRARGIARRRLVDDVRERLRAAWRARGASEGQLGWIARAFDHETLTIGFARRVPSYKRLTLVLHDADRLRRLLLDRERPVQLLVAGKAHPADEGGKQLIKQFAEFAADPAVRHRIAFLPDYDMAMARTLVSGCDVWLNNPLRPYEACGTSGMKAALNGSLNLSIRDGWWDELYDGENGWAIASADEGDPERRDEFEAESVFDLLERNVLPLFYDRPDGIPRHWIGMVRHSIVSLGPVVRASRMVRDYTERLYLPAAQTSRELSADGHRAARELAAWRARVEAAWPQVTVRSVDGIDDSFERGDRVPLRAHLSLGGLDPQEVEVQVVFGRVGDDEGMVGPTFVALKPVEREDEGWCYEGEFPLNLAGAFGYTVRVVPRHEDVAKPSELGLVTWA